MKSFFKENKYVFVFVIVAIILVWWGSKNFKDMLFNMSIFILCMTVIIIPFVGVMRNKDSKMRFFGMFYMWFFVFFLINVFIYRIMG